MSYSTTILGTPGLVAYWQFNETSGTTAVDSQGGLNATISAGVTVNQTGIGGGAFGFNGSSGMVSVTPSTSLSGTFTVECWFKTTSTNAVCLLGTRSGGSYFDVKVTGGNKIHADIGSGSSWLSTTADSTATITPANGSWHHFAYVVSAGTFTIYLDAVSVGTGTYSAGTAKLYDSATSIRIGASGDGSNPEWFSGTIDEVALYSTALSLSDVQSHYNAAVGNPAARVTQEGLVAVTQNSPTGRVTQEGLLAVTQNSPTGRVTQEGLLAVTKKSPTGRVSLLGVLIVYPTRSADQIGACSDLSHAPLNYIG